MKLLWVLSILIIYQLSLSDGQDGSELELRFRPDTVYEEVCKRIEHLLKDMKAYIAEYKRVYELILGMSQLNGTNECREELNQMFDIIKCLKEIAMDMEEKKNSVRETRKLFRDLLWKWLTTVVQKETKFYDIARRLKAKKFDVTEIEKLNRACLDVAQMDLLAMMKIETEFAVMQAGSRQIQSPWGPPVPDICEKIKILQEICDEFLKEFLNIRDKIWSNQRKRFRLADTKFPHLDMQRLCWCISVYCRLADELQGIVKNRSQTVEELEKRLCEWLMKLKDVRIKLLEYFQGVIGVTTGRQVKIRAARTHYKAYFKNHPFIDIIKKLDECLFKLDCLYLDFVTSPPTPRRG